MPDAEAWLRKQDPHAGLFIAAFLIILAILNHSVTVISPFKKYEKLEKNKFILLDQVTTDFLGQKLFRGNHIVANIRMPKRVIFSRLEPKKSIGFIGNVIYFKKCFIKKLLVAVWVSKGNAVPKKLKMTATQGVSGMAYSEGKAVIVDMTKGINDLNFNEKQIRTISGNGFVISYPIFAFDDKYSRIGTKIIGVVTLSCNKIGSENLIQDPKNRKILTDKIVEFSNICSLIL